MVGVAGFAQWLIMAIIVAMLVGAMRSASDKAAWLMALVVLLGVVASKPERIKAVNGFLTTVTGGK